MGRRQRRGNPISLFAFQDIITSVTGILILIAVLLTIVMITQETVTSAAPIETVEAGDIVAELEALKAQIESLEQRLNSQRQSLGEWAGYSPAKLAAEREALQSSVAALEQEIQQNQLDLQRRQAAFAQAGKSPELEKFQAEQSQMAEALEDSQEELQQLKTSNRVIYNFNQTTRQPWLVQIDGQGIAAAPATGPGQPRRFRSERDFVDFCRQLPEVERYVVLVVRPSGINLVSALRNRLENEDVEVGVELIGEAQTVVESPIRNGGPKK